MILFDPERERLGAVLLKQAKEPVRLPSARLLESFLIEAQKVAKLKGEVSVMVSTDAAIRKLNREYRGKDKATDVLSFPAEGIGTEGIAGDLMVSIQTALRQAKLQKHSLATEMKVLLLHGVLHLAGHDHETDEGQMAKLEVRLRAKLGLPAGLIERVEGTAAAKVAAKSKPVAAAKSTAKPSAKSAVKKVVAKKSAAKSVPAKKSAAKTASTASASRAEKKAPAAKRSGCGSGGRCGSRKGSE